MNNSKMGERSLSMVILLLLIAASFSLVAGAKKAKNQTDDCYKPCRVRSTPVCGNDGRNYTTGCHLSIARCRARKIGQRIYVMNTGYCQSRKPVSQCHINCTERRAPVCASDKKTYRNLCFFKKAKCAARKNKLPALTVVNRRGPCDKKTNKCRLNSSCPKVKRPVCGSDNRTYHNICFLKTRNCRLKHAARGERYKKLTLKYCGACGRGKRCATVWTQKCSEVKFCDQLLRAAVRYAEIKQVLGSKFPKKTGNPRAPRMQRNKSRKNRKNKKDLRKKNKKKTSTKKTNSKIVNTKKHNVKKLLIKKPIKDSAKIAPKRLFQVCGSDGVTYRSMCHLQVAQCNKMNRCQRLHKKHKGACKKLPSRRN